jgi:cyclophilin family peptidyl-prolyl cis-trans isomerase
MRRYTHWVFLFLIAVAVPFSFAAQNPRVVLETNHGDIIIELYLDQAPVTVENFLSYVDSGFYDGQVFHWVARDVSLKGGGFYYNFNDRKYYKPPTSDPIINESDNGLSNLRGTLAMDRLGKDYFGNPQPDTATSQFFINHTDNHFLDRTYPSGDGYGYCVFGAVVEGMSVVDEIAQIPTDSYHQTNPDFYSDALPTSRVEMISLYLLPCEVSYCAALADGNRIDFEDVAVIALYWLDVCDSANSFCGGADLDYSGGVDMVDLELFLRHWAISIGHEPQFSDLVVNNTIDLDDMTALMDHWLDAGCDESNDYCGGADVNHDGRVDLADYSLFSSNWLSSY